MNESLDQLRPRARKDVVVQELSDELLVYDLTRHKAHSLNRLAALVWLNCDGETTVGEIIKNMSERLKTPAAEEIVWYTLERLSKTQLLEKQLTAGAAPMMTRRKLLGKLGTAAVLSVPVIMSITSPTPAAAASCIIADKDCKASTVGCMCKGGGICKKDGSKFVCDNCPGGEEEECEEE